MKEDICREINKIIDFPPHDVYKELITELTEIARKFGEDVYVVWVLTPIMQKRTNKKEDLLIRGFKIID